TDKKSRLAIEAKFAEPYDITVKEGCPTIAEKYFSNDRKRWTEVGLPKCQALAEAMGRGISFYRLGATQLLKHILGLAFTNSDRSRAGVSLLYLWFDTGCNEAMDHAKEIDSFKVL